ncbi:uncharacterized protein N7459_007412 [Penicillium hispanicum]|uniref:uncharacterized protein n=1 Tax=Penicillium hispanicum TaxID=1080232 RepID=UPI00253FFD44|nr:uncharacterized protein N7459_007412 [Penicillium hispanicum]KAJ5578448.1 hypothetical protein N7459_007412 [Penicillium hispanicum]
MASIYYLNHPPNPFWDYLSTGLEDHPFFAPRGHHGHHHGSHRHHPPPFQAWGIPSQTEDATAGPEASRAAGQNPESTPGPSTFNEKRPETDKEADTSEFESGNDQRRPDKCGKRKHKGRHGMGHKGFYGGPGAGPFGHHHHPYAGPHGAGPFGPFGHPHPFGGPHGRGAHHRGRGGRGMHRGGPPPFGAPGVPDFDFLRKLAAQFGLPFSAPANNDVDFVPSVDVFDAPANYVVHVSLPGAKKDDLSIDYDPEESVLRLAGVVYRPGINEHLHQALVMEERAREVGVFEREVRLGTREVPAAVVADEITAKLEDGILNVTVPKIVEKPEPKKKVVVEDGNALDEKNAMRVDERASETVTPDESEESESEEEAREYVKIPLLFFGFFVIVVAIFHIRIEKSPTTKSQTERYLGRGQGWKQRNWVTILFALYVFSALILVRSIFRVLEYKYDFDGYIMTHEAFGYIFDTLLMLVTMVVMDMYHPAVILGDGKQARAQRYSEAVHLTWGFDF